MYWRGDDLYDIYYCYNRRAGTRVEDRFLEMGRVAGLATFKCCCLDCKQYKNGYKQGRLTSSNFHLAFMEVLRFAALRAYSQASMPSDSEVSMLWYSTHSMPLFCMYSPGCLYSSLVYTSPSTSRGSSLLAVIPWRTAHRASPSRHHSPPPSSYSASQSTPSKTARCSSCSHHSTSPPPLPDQKPTYSANY